MKFGDYVRKAREAKGWTQPEAAKRIEIEQSYLSKIENGKNHPAEDIFEKMVNVYAIDLAALARQVPTSELAKLSDVSRIRGLIRTREQQQVKSLRSWLIAGLAMLMLGAGSLIFELTKEPVNISHYNYVSDGILKPGESINVFQSLPTERKRLADLELQRDLFASNPDSKPQDLREIENMVAELHAKIIDIENRNIDNALSFTEHMGNVFLREVEGGKRHYKFHIHVGGSYSRRNNMLLAIAGAFLIGSLACFYIARRWR